MFDFCECEQFKILTSILNLEQLNFFIEKFAKGLQRLKKLLVWQVFTKITFETEKNCYTY